jgi:hypothetical protein
MTIFAKEFKTKLMTPKEKAEEFLLKFHIEKDVIFTMSKAQAKTCAIIAVNEIIKALREDLPKIGRGKGYWYSVRKEIEKLNNKTL